MQIPPEVQTQAHRVVTSLWQQPMLLHAILEATRNTRVLKPWESSGNMASERRDFENKRYAQIRKNGDGWLAVLTQLVSHRHPAFAGGSGAPSRTFAAESEAKAWADQILTEANFLLL